MGKHQNTTPHNVACEGHLDRLGVQLLSFRGSGEARRGTHWIVGDGRWQHVNSLEAISLGFRLVATVPSIKSSSKDGGMSSLPRSLCHLIWGKFLVWHIFALRPTKLTQVLAGLLEHFEEEMAATLTDMLDKLAHDMRTDLSVLFWCKSGTHRSVAMAQACGWVLCQLGAQVIGWVR